MNLVCVCNECFSTEVHASFLIADLTYCRGDADARIGSFTRLLHAERCADAESSLLLDECRGHVAYSHSSPCQSILSGVFLVFLSHAHSASFRHLVGLRSILCT